MKAIARMSRASGVRHRSAASNRRKPSGRRIGGTQAELSRGNAIHQSQGQLGRIMTLKPITRATPTMAVQEGRAIQSEVEVSGFTARRKPSAGIRLAATMSGVVCPLVIANTYAPETRARRA